jgi:hypothetical protein
MNKKEKSINEITEAFTQLSFAFNKFTMSANDLSQSISELYAEYLARRNRYNTIIWWIASWFDYTKELSKQDWKHFWD